MISSTSSVPASGATHQHLNSSASFPASLVARSLQELVKFPLRAVYQAEIFAFVTIPQSLARLIGFENVVETILMGNTRATRVGDTVAAAAATTTAANIGLEGATEAGVNSPGSSFSHFLHAMKRFSGFFSYMMSRWSLACFSVVRMSAKSFKTQTVRQDSHFLLGFSLKPGHNLCIYTTTSQSEMGKSLISSQCPNCTSHHTSLELIVCNPMSDIS